MKKLIAIALLVGPITAMLVWALIRAARRNQYLEAMFYTFLLIVWLLLLGVSAAALDTYWFRW